MLAFADLFHAMAPNVDWWGPPGPRWSAAFGPTGLSPARTWACCTPAPSVGRAGVVRPGARARLGARDPLLHRRGRAGLLYALGWYTPAFHAIYDLLPGIAYYRRPADATFVLGALIAVMAGYFVHCWLAGAVGASRRARSVPSRSASRRCSSVARSGSPPRWWARRARLRRSRTVCSARRRPSPRSRCARVRSAARRSRPRPLLALVMAADFVWNAPPHISTGLPSKTFEALAPDTRNETVRLIRRASPPTPRPTGATASR